jgi:hypothetical protein
MLNSFQVAGLLTHLFVLLIGAGALAGIVPLAHGRRAGLGLVLMAISMSIVVLEPRLQLGAVGVSAYVVGFLAGLWLLLGPERQHRRLSRFHGCRQDGSPDICCSEHQGVGTVFKPAATRKTRARQS